ncbi:MAG: hypothetical protein ACPL4I_11735 [Bacteroidota bacterium]
MLSLCLLFSDPLSAQFSVSATAPVTEDLINGLLNVFWVSDLDFGTVVQGVGPVTVQRTSPQAGKFRIIGLWFLQVQCTLTPPSNLSNGSATIPYTPKAAYNNIQDNPATAFEWQSPSGPQEPFYLRGNIDGSWGEAYVWVYGTINVGNVPPGDYVGQYTLTVTYY